ncbi:DUF2334 domain-containing protein [Spirillospora albida]|uniref:DUF2334 domain-containing protein n=1 Tax=Spirillospora albida TaxID=58123 RepID=UPI0004C1B46F|nr:polysaccharide deacetylase family protein [Spirillospora albida]
MRIHVFRVVVVLLATALVLAVTPPGTVAAPASAPSAARAAAFTGGPPGTGRHTLVLYDTTGRWGWLGELYATQIANLTGHFGRYTAAPVAGYRRGQMTGYTAVVYAGSTYDEPLPRAFLDDVRTSARPVVWLNHNIWRLAAAVPTFTEDYGWKWAGYDTAPVDEVRYKGRTLTRDVRNKAGIMDYASLDPAKAAVLATARRTDGTTLPWAVRSRNLTYIGEMPLAYTAATDRYLAFADLLFDALAPGTATRRRALVRLEDVGPASDPADLTAAARLLAGRGVPFSFGVFPVHEEGGRTVRLAQRPRVVAAIRYMLAHGGTMIMHGYTHQFGTLRNPYNGTSGDDFEFYRAHVDAGDRVRYDGPVPGDSAAWALSRVSASAAAFAQAGLPVPAIFEFPHYAGSPADYRAVGTRFARRYERALYFTGTLSGRAPEYGHMAGQFFPYAVTDVYGTKVVPENLGNVVPTGYNQNPAVTPADIIAAARANLVVRDGTASFFYHPYLGVDGLHAIVDGIRALGYRFSSPGAF